jgi:hypothetical protein
METRCRYARGGCIPLVNTQSRAPQFKRCPDGYHGAHPSYCVCTLYSVFRWCCSSRPPLMRLAQSYRVHGSGECYKGKLHCLTHAMCLRRCVTALPAPICSIQSLSDCPTAVTRSVTAVLSKPTQVKLCLVPCTTNVLPAQGCILRGYSQQAAGQSCMTSCCCLCTSEPSRRTRSCARAALVL